ncbi:MAG: hypothetical protein WCA08_17070 [Desulfoferrobacter sp.]
MADRTIAAICASGLFVAVVLIGLAGADKPPPPGFLLLVGLIALLCAVAFFRLEAHLAAQTAAGWRMGMRIGLEGAASGGVTILALSLSGGGESTVVASTESRLIGAAVVALVGAALALVIWTMAVRLKASLGIRS